MKNTRVQFFICLAVLFLFALVLYGKPVPHTNEFNYLLRLEKLAHPHILAVDWTFSRSADEHWLFNRVFSLLAFALPLEAVGWIGRIASWLVLFVGLLLIGKRWEIPLWQITVSIFLWLAFDQAFIVGESMIAGFEAKVVAYVCLLFALDGFLREKTFLPAALLGLTFSFHPAVGLWGGLAAAFALLVIKTPFKRLINIGVTTIVFALPGVVPLVGGQVSEASNTPEVWRFLVLNIFYFHLDPTAFPRIATAALFGMLLFNFAALRREDNRALQFLLWFQAATGAFFLLGIILRLTESYELLRFMPFRLFPLFTPLSFLFTVFRVFSRSESPRFKAVVVVIAVLALLSFEPIDRTYRNIAKNYQRWLAPPDDLQQTSVWLSQNTPENAVVIQPPTNREHWYYSKRATVASAAYPPYDRLPEWYERMRDLTGDKLSKPKYDAALELEAAYNALSPEQIGQIQKKYGATHLVSRAEYSYRIIFTTETYKVYQLE